MQEPSRSFAIQEGGATELVSGATTSVFRGRPGKKAQHGEQRDGRTGRSEERCAENHAAHAKPKADESKSEEEVVPEAPWCRV